MAPRSLIPLGEGVYTVPEVCRILQPGMTSRKVHYWLDTRLLSAPIAWGGPGRPTLLSFQQLLEIRTVQRLRDELQFSLPRVRAAFSWVLEKLFAPHWRDLRFERHGSELAARAGRDILVIPGGQRVLPLTVDALNEDVSTTRSAWESRIYAVPDHEFVVSDTHVLAGAPTVRGTRVETALLASFADDHEMDQETLAQVVRMFPVIPQGAVEDALAFEGVRLAS